MMTPHRAIYHKPISHISNGPVFLAAATGAWLLVAGLGYGFWLLVTALERAA